MKTAKIKNTYINHEGRNAFWELASQGKWEPQTFDVLDRFLNTEGVFYDIGAWNGVLSLYAAKKGTKCKAYEPDLIAFSEFSNNIRLNPDIADKITLSSSAVGIESGTAFLSNIESFGNSMSTTVHQYAHIPLTEVPLIDIENAITDTPCLVKIDIEGGEFDLFKHKMDFLVSITAPIYISIHPHLIPEINLDEIYNNFKVDISKEHALEMIEAVVGFELLLKKK